MLEAWVDLILGHVRQQGDKASPQDGRTNSPVPFGTGSGPTPRQNSTVSVDQCLERLQVFVVHINRSR